MLMQPAMVERDLMIEASDVEGCREELLLSGATWRIMGTCAWSAGPDVDTCALLPDADVCSLAEACWAAASWRGLT